jgi:L-ascorbate metabolism protein UlaG (beta-lactamase superfamily)
MGANLRTTNGEPQTKGLNLMKRRQLMRYTKAGLLTAIGTGLASGFESYRAQGKGSLSIQWLGHTCCLFTGGGQRILVNPFEKLGCTAKYRSPKVSADLVLASSLLLDEGAIKNLPGNPKIVYEPGVYQVGGVQIQGIGVPHDRLSGRRFGTNVAWKWKQGGINILHLGSAAGPIEIEQKILMGRPDVLLVPVGGGVKGYNPQEAKQAIQALNPKVVIPTYYRTQAADSSCDLVGVDDFLNVMSGSQIRRLSGDRISMRSSDLPPEGPLIRVLSYNF